MVATNDEFPLKKQTSPKGVSGIEISGGVYEEDYLQKLKGVEWAKEADKMRTQDSQVKMILASVQNPIRSATWEWIPSDSTNAQAVQMRDFVEFILTCDMNRSWNVFINEILTFVPFGHSVFEIIHKNVSNHPKFGSYTGIKSMSYRSPKTLEEWVLDQATGELEGILQRSQGDFTNDIMIPADFLVVFTLDQEGNYFASTSHSWLRPVYGNFLIKQFLKKLKAIGHEKMTVGTPLGTVSSDATDEQENKFEQMLQRYTSNQSQYLKVPEGYKVEILRGEFNAAGLETAIEAENQEMVRAFLANFLNLGQGSSSGGSFALGQDLSDFFLKGIQYVAELICDTVNSRIIPHIIDINFGEQEEYPKLICSGVQDVGKEMSEIIGNYVTAGAIVVDPTLRGFLRKLHKLPPEDEIDESAEPTQPTPEVSDPAVGDENIVQDPVGDIAEPDAATPNPTANEADVASDTQSTSDIIPTTDLSVKTINKGADALEEVVAFNLDFIANKLQADIVNRFKNLPENRKGLTTRKIQAGGVNQYKKDLRTVLTNIATVAVNEAEVEAKIDITKFATKTPAENFLIAVDIASGEAKASFPKLSRNNKDKIISMAEDIANAHAADLEKAAKFAANSSIETTADADILAQDIREATNSKSKQLLNATPVTSSSEIVNHVRLDTFLRQESKDAGVVGFEFFNADPKSLICRNLAGRKFLIENKEAARHFPPLHFRCKSELKPIFGGSRKEKEINDDLGLQIVGKTGAEVTAINNSIQFSDSQIIQLLADVQLSLTFQTLLFNRNIFSRGQASAWAATRGFSTVDVDETDHFIAIRQRDPDEFREGSLNKISITQGVKAMAGDLLGDFEQQMPFSEEYTTFASEGTEDLQALIFSKKEFTKERAIQFARDHKFAHREITETSREFIFNQKKPEDFIHGSIKKIKVTVGLDAKVGRIKNVK